jgi:hypothetical protein
MRGRFCGALILDDPDLSIGIVHDAGFQQASFSKMTLGFADELFLELRVCPNSSD